MTRLTQPPTRQILILLARFRHALATAISQQLIRRLGAIVESAKPLIDWHYTVTPIVHGKVLVMEVMHIVARVERKDILLEVGSKLAEGGWLAPELLRLKGELLLLRGEPADAEASEALFRQALDAAHQQGALSWELRAATSMARLWRDQDRRHQAFDLLGPVYGWFTEGFDTLDLKEAEALLRELA